MLDKLSFGRTFKDYFAITIGLILCAGSIVLFLMPYELTTGGLTGIALIVYYATNGAIPVHMTFFFVNFVLLGFALKILGVKFLMKTIYGWLMLSFLLWLFQELLTDPATGTMPKLMGEGQEFMATVVGAGILGFSIGLVFSRGGSTGGTDIISWIVNKYKNVSLGRMMMYCDIVIISSCYFVFHDWKRVMFGYCILFIMSMVIDFVINSSRQSVQFFIFSKESDKVAEAISTKIGRGVTLLHGTGWYTKSDMDVIVVIAKKTQNFDLFRVVKNIDPDAFISQTNVVGVYGEGFDQLKIK